MELGEQVGAALGGQEEAEDAREEEAREVRHANNECLHAKNKVLYM